jgi:O-6-methylguanine DNA methyltransferase
VILAEFPKIRVQITDRVELFLADSFQVEGASPIQIRWLRLYANRAPDLFEADEILEDLAPFYKTALKQLQQVPFGETLSYAELAKKAGNEKAVRAAGSACNRNPLPLFIPCHRVLQSSGGLGGFAFGLEIKKRLLDFEGKNTSPSKPSATYC